ncbi:IS701 family transposase [Streptomyces johnsoniae]|uniref:Transposase n=1 Tax=Streptomyces johnsoniae TaxID=3075532 RepID=A0ABU2RXF2_9ACTN|nr:transposase [Streptomyces sp. DSM 41886]MDT0441431.1 transposase [Streptomyces sp. DSM 41886]
MIVEADVGLTRNAPGEFAAWSVECSSEALRDLCHVLFASLQRSDQRRRGMDYIRGLVHVEGRKSIRNIASLLGGGQAVEQSLHHFVCDSTWQWDPIREALARYMTAAAPPLAWVVHPLVIPKSGDSSVGVERRASPTSYTQRAVGVWLASEHMACPVNWRLLLSRSWVEDPLRREQACIPERTHPETLGTCAVEASLRVARGWRLPARPLLVDAREMDAPAVLGGLRKAGLPQLLRVDGRLRLTVADEALRAHNGGQLSAEEIMRVAARMRRPCLWRAPDASPGVRRGTLAAVRVRVPTPAAGAAGGPQGGELLLLGVAEAGQQWPAELWLTDAVSVPPAALVQLSRLMQRVGRDFAEIGDRVGIRDFVGRSFTGWHRHITLASAAHAVAALSRPTARHFERAS